ncbi:MAG: ASKHA domain-containing protein [Chloroflexota bacterium]|nr:ASKHA domain-containing protein [Chloroflexota bacterium]
MTEKVTVDFEPLGRRARVVPGTTLLEAARQAGVGLNGICGGLGTCGTCRVRIVAGQVTPPTETEHDILFPSSQGGMGGVAEGFRLACQTGVLGDVRVDIPPASVTAPQRAQIEGRERPVELDPAVHAFDVVLAPSSLTDLRADATRLRDALCRQSLPLGEEGEIRFDHGALCQLSPLLRDNGWHIRVIVRDGEVIAAAPAGAAPLGLAVDIGTTKLAAYLVNLESGETLASDGVMNPQIAYGEDVMARIAYAMDGEAQARDLQLVIAGGLDDLARKLCAQAGRESVEIVDAVLVGNTCMHHLVLGLPVAQLGLAPYVPALAASYGLKARELGLGLAPGASVHLLPNIAGFVGADHVAMLLATGLHEAREVTVGLDIGTNTEISLAVGGPVLSRAEGRLLSCSCASGPAFEGAHIHDGMRAAPGAVEWVRLVGERVEYQTIDNKPPVGICGSGVLDGVAELRRVGMLRANGAIRPGSHPRFRVANSGSEFLLVPAGERGAPRDLVITRKDVNEIQLAKGAIRAGIEVLLSEAGLEAEQIERVVVAGAFGTYLDVDSALAVGMFPPLARERFVQVGNAAGMGAKLALVSRRCRGIAEEIARRVEYVELTTHPRFVEAYMNALMLAGLDRPLR